MNHGRKISVVGLGYVGLPVAVAFARGSQEVIGFDTDEARLTELRDGYDRTHEVSKSGLSEANLRFTGRPEDLKAADFHIIAVPTPIDGANQPDLGPLLSATRTVGVILKPGDVVVYESTVYPGATEEECVPLLEKESGLTYGRDFSVGYSPERINPGDVAHRFETITKVVSGSDAATLDIVAAVYGSVITAGVHRAPDIKTAEAAKVIENTQRDLNIAFMNELALIFDRLGIDTRDVIAAASTKWNFLPFSPGLVGGHCIGVDPFYLTYRAEQAGIHPQVILAGRGTNDSMGRYVAGKVVDLVGGTDGRSVNVLGITFKENIPDIRNSKVIDLVRGLADSGMEVRIADPEADPVHVRAEYGVELTDLASMAPSDAVVVAVPHRHFSELGWPGITSLLKGGEGIVADIRGVMDRATTPAGVTLWRL